MAYIIPPRRDKSSQRMKRKAFLKEGEDSCMKMSSVATQWTALSSAAENHFTDMAQKKVLYFWDVGHYYQESEKRSKPLTPLARFRIRERFLLPPENICPNGRKKATLPKEATNVLRGWLDNNSPRPYPTRETTKAALADLTGLTVMQVNTWFANTRRRMRGKRRTPLNEEEKSKQPYAWNRPRRGRLRGTGVISRTTLLFPTQHLTKYISVPVSPQPWQVPIFSTTMTSTPSAFAAMPWCLRVSDSIPTIPGADIFGFNFTRPLVRDKCQTPGHSWSGQGAAVGNQYLPSPMVALAPTLWEPELQYYGLHAAAQILMDMASK
ncbi:hypothetical protein OS493_013615 [Desmophyllum pertusum]|uniref:Homeobox domain-containing protein n=1 Tax=Desmophyllum pertusum TaxID=174260 RepID=A0A9X0A2L1_9CNID|nr:hypothetical protein OS493_013615 [Desmophyllum pertusum]